MFQLIIILKNKCSVLEIITTNESDEFNIAIIFIFKFVLYIYQYRKNLLYTFVLGMSRNIFPETRKTIAKKCANDKCLVLYKLTVCYRSVD